MNVLMISDVYFPRINGVSTSIQTFRQMLKPLGIDSLLVAPAYPHAPEQVADEIRVPSRYLPFDPEDRLMRYQALNRALAAIPPDRYDLIHIQTPFAAHYAGIRLAKHVNKPTVITYHTLFAEYVHCYAPWLPSSLGRHVAQGLSKRQCNQADMVIAPSRLMESTLRRYGITTPIQVVPTGIPIERFQHGNRMLFRQRHQIPDHQIVALFVGRVAHEKNLPLLITAFELALQTQPHLLLVIAGEGPAKASIEAMVKKRGLVQSVRFIGYLDREKDLPDCYHAADLFVFPSLTETQGLVLIEAMAAGLPVVGIPAMGASEIILADHGSLPVRNCPHDMANMIIRLAENTTLRAELSRAAKAFARTWGDDAMAAKLAQAYERVTFGQAGQHESMLSQTG
ncbi:glycosyltransferase involved in cell wall biosynthesis [Chitinivorax tropicus]|uniref:Glycosyltransferase involved in cell wall biosynthesis n=1 Tax=Chitinivorax tropicus TaxID=714531 RepID=A0A840MTB8_9PROT|nr:glycosyltransferase [Chitinivorax tropicus]MBB5020329.1 glycosyltransferase involved in cell wall biosynthesis [Chitinivorax tropicus]